LETSCESYTSSEPFQSLRISVNTHERQGLSA
jgi:hypothetical protein